MAHGSAERRVWRAGPVRKVVEALLRPHHHHRLARRRRGEPGGKRKQVTFLIAERKERERKRERKRKKKKKKEKERKRREEGKERERSGRTHMGRTRGAAGCCECLREGCCGGDDDAVPISGLLTHGMIFMQNSDSKAAGGSGVLRVRRCRCPRGWLLAARRKKNG
jgi:hypothetical protein